MSGGCQRCRSADDRMAVVATRDGHDKIRALKASLPRHGGEIERAKGATVRLWKTGRGGHRHDLPRICVPRATKRVEKKKRKKQQETAYITEAVGPGRPDFRYSRPIRTAETRASASPVFRDGVGTPSAHRLSGAPPPSHHQIPQTTQQTTGLPFFLFVRFFFSSLVRLLQVKVVSSSSFESVEPAV